MILRVATKRPSRARNFLVFLTVFLALFFWLTTRPISWQLSFTAKTEIAALELVADTQWDIGDGEVCVRTAANHANNEAPKNSICGDASWKTLSPPDEKSAGRWLALRASPERPLRVTLETSPSGAVTMSLRGQEESIGRLNFHEDSKAAKLPSRVNIIWPAIRGREPMENIILPFTGAITAGRDVSWSTRKMLTEGNLSIYAASDESLAGRALAEEAALLPGDQVVLRMIPDINESMFVPKGFLRFDAQPPYADFPKTMTVVAFALAESALIQRFGGGEYDFTPGWWVRVKHRSELVIFLVLLTGALSIASSIAGLYSALRKPSPLARPTPADKKKESADEK